jgi:hypothetical protein
MTTPITSRAASTFAPIRSSAATTSASCQRTVKTGLVEIAAPGGYAAVAMMLAYSVCHVDFRDGPSAIHFDFRENDSSDIDSVAIITALHRQPIVTLLS